MAANLIIGTYFIITPLGKIVNCAGGPSPKVVGNKVVFGDIEEVFDSQATAQNYYNYLSGLISSSAGSTGTPAPPPPITLDTTDHTADVTLTIEGGVFTNYGAEQVTIDGLKFAFNLINSSKITVTIPANTFTAGSYGVTYKSFFNTTWVAGGFTLT